VPLFGYRRKSYLILANTLTAIAFVVMACAGSLQVILTALFFAAVGMASSTAITVGLAVEQGKEGGKARDYFSQQTFFYYLALMAASVGGGVLCHIMAPEMALHRAASIAFAPPLIVSLLTLFLVREKKSKLDREQLRKSWTSFKSLRHSAFWLVALFIFLWDFSPSFGIPLYFHESNVLKFSQSFIGQLGAWNSAGMVIGLSFTVSCVI
jgi:MFS family permease